MVFALPIPRTIQWSHLLCFTCPGARSAREAFSGRLTAVLVRQSSETSNDSARLLGAILIQDAKRITYITAVSNVIKPTCAAERRCCRAWSFASC